MERGDLLFLLEYQRGVLSSILNKFDDLDAEIVTLNQDIPMTNIANALLTLDSNKIKISIDELMTEIKKVHGVHNINLKPM